MKDNENLPIINALKKYVHKKVFSYDVPGHKHISIDKNIKQLFTSNIYKYDLNSPIGLDNIINPNGVIKYSLKKASTILNSDNSLYLINGSSSGIHIMIMSVCKENEKIILPRNVHKSVINALIFSGAIPIFINPSINFDYGIPNNITSKQYIDTIKKYDDAKAVFITYPSYYGSYIDILPIIKFAHRMHIAVLVDQAHGAHFSFHPKLPISSSLLGADLIVMSTHKTIGSLTQSSILLHNGIIINFEYLKKIYLMFCTTSPSYLLLSSLESSINNISQHGKKKYNELISNCIYIKKKINELPGLSVFGLNTIDKNNFDQECYDPTKVVINISKLGFSGFEIYNIMFKVYNIQLELAEPFIVLAIIGIGDTKNTIIKLYSSFKNFVYNKKFKKSNVQKIKTFNKIKNIILPFKNIFSLTPRKAFFYKKELINISDSIGNIAGETITLYPPGIPICIIGEILSKEIISKLLFYNKYLNIKIQKASSNKDKIFIIKKYK